MILPNKLYINYQQITYINYKVLNYLNKEIIIMALVNISIIIVCSTNKLFKS